MTLRLSGVVTTRDHAATLQACLASLAFGDEIVVLDSGSTDATGWAGYFAARVQAFHAFPRYFKVLEAKRQGAAGADAPV